MKIRRFNSDVIHMLAAVFGLMTGPAWAQQDFPAKPLRIYVPAVPGGTIDLAARMVSTILNEGLGQPVVVENRYSASGALAADLTAKALPDGYTLFLAYHQHTVSAVFNPDLPYHPINSFTPVTQLTSVSLVLLVNASAPVKNLKEFVEWTRNAKGALNFGSAGEGSGGHLAGELYNVTMGIKSQHIPYKGSGPSLIDLIGGRYDYSFAGLQPGLTQVRAGKLRALAVTSPKRLSTLPELPAMAEMIPGFEVVGWAGVLAPANLPAPILSRLNAEISKGLHKAEIRSRLLQDGSEVVGSSPQAFHQFMLADLDKWAKVFKATGARLN